ncbi:response regulator transcription factor [candidate division KSB1 bacterium]|nr:response regulator transcription factor [candidate division KSB1 bacterium]MBL7093702.1 response regulator transcription factor [candidate division KSB1 bacterium]
MKILVIDQDKFLAENLCRYLKQNKQIQIWCISTINEVNAEVSKNKYDLIISELFMPGVEDENWLFEIEEKNPGQKYVIISSYQIPNNFNLSEKLNIIAYYEKPFDVKIIANLIKQLTN